MGILNSNTTFNQIQVPIFLEKVDRLSSDRKPLHEPRTLINVMELHGGIDLSFKDYKLAENSTRYIQSLINP